MKQSSRPHFHWDVCLSNWAYSLSQTSEDRRLMLFLEEPRSGVLKLNCSLGRKQWRTNVLSCDTFTLLLHRHLKVNRGNRAIFWGCVCNIKQNQQNYSCMLKRKVNHPYQVSEASGAVSVEMMPSSQSSWVNWTMKRSLLIYI